MTKAIQITAAAFLITAAAIKAVPAFAEPAPVSANVSIVHTADIDLSTNAGRRQLDQRLVIATREVCGNASDADIAGKNQIRACRHNVLSDARSKSDAIIAGRGGDRTILVASTR